MTPTRARGAQDSAGANSRRCGGSRELLAPSPAKAGEGWGGVSFGSARPVGTPSQPPPAVAGGGAKSSRLPPLLQTAQESPGQRSAPPVAERSEEHTSELHSPMRISNADLYLKKNN